MKQAAYVLRPAASRELRRLVLYFQNEAGSEIATRFVERTQKCFSALAEEPGLGSPVMSRNPALKDLRKARVEGFARILVFYQPHDSGIRIVHLLHATSDWRANLAAD